MSRGLTWVAGALLLGAAPAWGQITPTVPSAGANVVGPADDYATRTFQDPWDMNEHTDLGWFTLGADSPPANLANLTVAGGIFSGTPTNTDPNFFLLDTYIPPTVNTGKQGKRFPIDAARYRVLMLRMNLAQASTPPGQAMQILWSNNTIFPPGGFRTSNSVLTNAGWWYYDIDLFALGTAGGGPAWSGLVDSLRIDPTQFQVNQIQVDWARLVPLDNPNLLRPVQWTGNQFVDVFLDNNNNAADGTLGQVRANQNGGAGGTKTFSFYFGGLAPGDYFVALRQAGTANPLVYSPGFYRVVALPTLRVTAPSEEGSADDFATVQLNNPWDMNALGDVDLTHGLSGMSISSIAAVNEAGQNLGSVQVLNATSTPAPPGGVGDPEVYPLYSTVRGFNYRIDADRYRVLVAEFGIPGPRNVATGSVARIVWKIADEALENVSEDIVVNHRAGVNVLHKLVLDMKTLQLETDPGGSPSLSGWINGGGPNPGINHFRLDPHEFSPPTGFFIRRIKLAAFERANATYRVSWAFSNPSALGGLTLRLIADTDEVGCNGTTIASGLNPAVGQFDWSISMDVPSGGARYVCAQLLSGGTVINQAYSRWPVVRDSTFGGVLTRLAADRSVLRYGAVNSAGTLTSVTPPQQVTVSQIGGSPAPWSVASDAPWVTVSPSIGSGSGTFTVSISNPGGVLPGSGLRRSKITISSTEADNSPQYIDVFVQTRAPGTTSAPFGFLDTPTNGITGVTGAIAVTGWALDDIAVDRVEIYRDRITGDAPPSPNGKIFIGTGTFVPGARPDVEALNPTMPMAYRAAWGYMLLTNMLPNRTTGASSGGNGLFTLHAYAIDKEAKTVLLGSRTVTLDNANAVKPFGTIDTPGQGETVSGLLHNFGWILTPQPGIVPTNGSTISVLIDGVSVGQPQYNLFRQDIATLFPGYANSNGAVGHLAIDTTSLANGLHTIMWLVTDNLGRTEGIGSRYFSVLN